MIKMADLTTKQNGVYGAVSPLGDATLQAKSLSPSLDTLAGKTVGELSVDMYNYDISFPLIRKILKERYKGIKFVPHSRFPEITMMTPGPEYQKYVENQVALLKQHECDAVILGNGG